MTLPRIPLPAYRIAETMHGDTIQDVAFRELGDASRWPELATVNKLRPPFITDDADLVVPGVLLAGDGIKVPVPKPFVSANRDPEDVFLRDVALEGKALGVTESGDFNLVGGVANLRQALNHACITPRGDLQFHPAYGSMVPTILGKVSSPTATIMAAQYAKSVVEADERIASVTNSRAEALGDAINVTVQAETVYGRPINLQVTF